MWRNIVIIVLAGALLATLFQKFWVPVDGQNYLELGINNYKNCIHGGHECYYIPGSAEGVLQEMSSAYRQVDCYENTQEMQIIHKSDRVDVVFRCETQNLIGEYDVVIKGDRPSEVYMTRFAYARKSSIVPEIGTISASDKRAGS